MDPIDRYRDVILVDAVETLVVKQVKYAVRKCRKIFEKNSFVGLSFGNVETQLVMFSLSCQWTRSARCSSTFTAGPAGEGWRSHIPSVTTGSRSSRSTSSPTWASYSSWVSVGGGWEWPDLFWCSGVVRQFTGSDSESCWRCKAREAAGEEETVKIDSISNYLCISLSLTNPCPQLEPWSTSRLGC